MWRLKPNSRKCSKAMYGASSPKTLFVMQRCYGVDLCCASRWHIRCKQHNDHQDECDQGECCKVGRGYTKQLAGKEPTQSKSAGDANGRSCQSEPCAAL